MLHLTNNNRKAAASVIALLFALGLIVGGLGSFYLANRQISTLNNKITQLSETQNQNQTITNQTVTVYQNGSSLVDIYSQVSDSVVLIHATLTDNSSDIQGSGFIYNYSGRIVVLTNYHVVQGVTGISVTFSDGNGYSALVLGTDPYSDLAVLSVSAPNDELKPLTIVSSSSLRVGDQVIAIGNPYGLVGSLTSGIVSALGRSEQADFTSSFSIANMIQTSTPINPGNSGGPLLNNLGNVVGITNSIITNSQGLGFAVPSNTILREIGALISTGTYNKHAYLGVHILDMNYDMAQYYHIPVTYGVYLPQGQGQTVIEPNGPAAGKLNEGDVITALNSSRIRNSDDLASYLEERTLPNDLLIVSIVRNGATQTVNLTLGTRPPASV